ncbi:MAG: hypothetical protein GY799_29950 [Desulfobulbaceae bacterium]|nr:hypothetical protein [Desulfobulbaceae bacterium]
MIRPSLQSDGHYDQQWGDSVLEVHKVSWKNPLNNGSERLAKCPIIVENGATTGLSAHFQGRSVEVWIDNFLVFQ